MSQQQAQYRITDSDTGRRLMDYASRAHADAWIATHPEYRVYSQHTDSPNLDLHAIYVEKQSSHAVSVEG
jgi:hypothetical protein